MKRTPMKRTAWPAREPLKKTEPKEHLALTQQASNAVKSIARKSTYAVVSREVCAAPITKSAPVRNEAYRRAVASLPCVACGIPGYSQAAHLPPEAKGLKQSDLLAFPLCCARIGVPGCHQDYDQYRMYPKHAAMTVGRAWAADTQRKIQAMGLWPKTLPYPATPESPA